MVQRITGLASGMDIDTMVSNLMKAERASVDKLSQKKQLLSWQQDAYKDVNSKMVDFRSNKLFNFTLESTLKAKKATLSGNTTAITAIANANAIGGTVTVTVGSLATPASNASNSDIRLDTTFDPSQTLGSQANKIRNNFTQTIPGRYDTATISINGTQVTIDPNVDSLNSVINKINQTTNVSAFYDSSSGKVSFTAKQTGVVNGSAGNSATIDFRDITGSFMASSFLTSNGSANEKAAANANVTINGLSTTRTSNTFNVNGVDITLLQAGGTVTNVNVTADADKIVDSIKGFIKDYNDMLSTLQGKVNEAKYQDYPPLTDDQKKAMKDNDIKLWEDKAKSGLLKDDSMLSKAVSDMRMDMVSQVNTGDPLYTTLSSIGIKSTSYMDNGKLYLTDENKLRAAIAADPNAVYSIFAAPGSGDPSRRDMGAAQRMYGDLKNAMDAISKKAGTSSFASTTVLNINSSMGKQLTDLNKQIDSENKRLKDVEDRYYKQFTAMEKALSSYNSQSAYLANAFGNGQKQNG